MQQETITDEFVRHFHKLRDRADSPSGVKRALDKNPDLADSLERLYEILDAIARHRKYSKRRFIDQDHREFATALSQFKGRWSRCYAYTRGWPAAVNDFIRHYQILVDQTDNRPGELLRELDKNSDLAVSMGKLVEIQDLVTASSRVDILFQEYPKFVKAFNDFQQHWSEAREDYSEWRISKIRLKFDTNDAGINFDNPLPPVIEAVAKNYPAKEERSPFDPDRDSIATVMEEAENYLGDCGDYSADESAQRWAWGLAWLRTTVDFQDFEQRWRDFPEIIVPRHLRNEYNPDDSRAGLYAYLNQIRSAYIFGADLAAVALCRAIMELLIRVHYASDVPDASDSKRWPLPSLIETVQTRKSRQFLSEAHLITKVRQANAILHNARSGGSTFDPRHLVIEWVDELKKMITKVQ